MRSQSESSEIVVPDGIDPIVGWRAWTVKSYSIFGPDNYNLLLSSVCRGTLWPVKEKLTAISNPQSKTHCPQVPCNGALHDDSQMRCGIHSTTRSRLEVKQPCHHSRFRVEWNEQNNGNYADVVGEVYSWGRVIKGPFGFIAQYAYPKHFYVLDPDLMEVLKPYGVPINLWNYPDDHFYFNTEFRPCYACMRRNNSYGL